MRVNMGALKNQAEQIWTSHQVTFLNVINAVAGDALQNHKRSLRNAATTELQRHRRPSHDHLQENQQGVRRHMSEVRQEVQVHQVASGEEVDILRHELSQSLAAGSPYQNLYTTCRLGASKAPPTVRSCDKNVITLMFHGRNLGNRNASKSKGKGEKKQWRLRTNGQQKSVLSRRYHRGQKIAKLKLIQNELIFAN